MLMTGMWSALYVFEIIPRFSSAVQVNMMEEPELSVCTRTYVCLSACVCVIVPGCMCVSVCSLRRRPQAERNL